MRLTSNPALAIAGAELFHDLEKLLRSGFVQEVEFGEEFVGGGLALANVGDEELEAVGDEAPDGGLGRGWAIEATVGVGEELGETLADFDGAVFGFDDEDPQFGTIKLGAVTGAVGAEGEDIEAACDLGFVVIFDRDVEAFFHGEADGRSIESGEAHEGGEDEEFDETFGDFACLQVLTKVLGNLA